MTVITKQAKSPKIISLITNPIKSYNYHIAKTKGIRSGKPRISGRRITVSDIVIWHIREKKTIDVISSEFDLLPAQIYAALAYYYDNQREIDEQISQADKAWQEGYDAQSQKFKDVFKQTR